MPGFLRHVIATRARNGTRTRVARRRPVPQQPRALEHAHLALQLGILRKVKAAVERLLLPQLAELARQARTHSARDSAGVRADGYVDVLASIMDALEAAAREAQGRDRDLLGDLAQLGRQVDGFNGRETTRTIRELTGIELTAAAPGLDDKIATFARQNAQLIKSVPADYLYDIEQATLRYLREGRRAEELAGELEDRYGVAANRAALIAVDQIGKLNGELTEARHTNLGITRYYWRTAGDERVRPDHARRDGEIFEYAHPPEDGNPGFPIRCRCYADPLIEDLLGA